MLRIDRSFAARRTTGLPQHVNSGAQSVVRFALWPRHMAGHDVIELTIPSIDKSPRDVREDCRDILVSVERWQDIAVRLFCKKPVRRAQSERSWSVA
jgi:hypothetical protein